MATTAQPTQEFVPIKEIRDGIIVRTDGTLCAVLLISSINLGLKSADEQQAILQMFQSFLNTLDFQIQITIQSRRYDVRPYILMLENRYREQTEPLLRVQTREYIEFIQTFTESVNIMRKSFYIIIPYAPAVLNTSKGIMKTLSGLLPIKKGGDEPLKDFEEERMQLEQRIGVVQGGFDRMGLRSIQLGTQEIIELFYKTFNPGETAGEAKGL